MKKIAVVPAYNEEKTVATVVKSLRTYFDEVIVANDGSKDSTAQLATDAGAKVYTNIINRGLGGAISLGIAAALKEGADVIVTCDADGQHTVEDAVKVIAPVAAGHADIAIGSRIHDHEGMPLIRRIYNWVGNIVTLILFGVWTTDSQSGLRALSRRAAESINIRTNGMEVSSEIISEIKRRSLRFVQVPITAIYTEHSLSKPKDGPSGQHFFHGVKTFVRLVLYRVSH